MDLEFSGQLWFWRGPAPWHFVTVPDDGCRQIADAAPFVSYGWGCVPVRGQIGDTQFETSLIPKDGRYLVPVKTAVRRAEALELGDQVPIRLVIDA
ncbi:hypothetical protein N864_10000 [Intrasporangium chromatireducens Q5-1]|uniref:DUF1905 domain-containing protein n=1 Tax=Intrasporangium chromatireducens Q5-1 TaxID=584657 RepID=W9GFF4_9MICO|nr:DUF1905 domain-containing protein [Intrasporangium chromatireducens]EWT04805.1 hypothetical protein N864_10000 [Intrasporangium chromatireducens Q5-1]